MIPPNLRQDWLRNTGLLLALFVSLLIFLSWTLYRTVLGEGQPVIGGTDAVPMELGPGPETGPGIGSVSEPSAQMFDFERWTSGGASESPESESPARVESEQGLDDAFGGIPPAISPAISPAGQESPRFAPQEAESQDNFSVEHLAGLGASFVRREGWSRREVLLAEGDVRAADRADVDVVLEAPDGGSRLALSAWNAAERVPFELWVLSVAGGMSSVDGQYPHNAVIGGAPALIVGDPETPTSPVRYAAFLDRGTHYVRLAWSGGGASADPYDFARALVTLAWNDSIDTGANVDTVPGFDLPSGLYYPSELLFASP